MVEKKIAVIGAGLGGLSAAVRLANAGYKVEVFEQNSNPGGKANEINEKGFRFDTGPSLLTMPFVIEELFSDTGENIEDFLEIEKLKITCKYFWNDGTVINAYSDIDKFAEEVEAKTIDTARAIFDYLKYSKKIYELTSDIFLFNSLSNIKNLLSAKSLKTLMQIHKIDPFRTMHRANEKFFSDKKTIQLFDRYATYNGSNPYKVPATLNIIQHVEYNLGSYIPRKGMYSIVNALHQLAVKNGARFHFNTKVKRIVHNNKNVSGVLFEQNDQEVFHESDIVVSNADVNFTYQNLLNVPGNKSAKKYSSLEPSSSAMVFYWGVKGIYNELETHNILFSEDYQKEFVELFEEKVCPANPTVYIYVSSKFNSSDAPAGCENWFVMINAPAHYDQDWEREINRVRNTIIKKIKDVLKIDLNDKIVYERILTPVDIENNSSSFRGSIYGISSNNKSAAFLRQGNRSKDFKGLYFCGGSAHPGGGIPLVLLSGKITSDLIKRYEAT